MKALRILIPVVTVAGMAAATVGHTSPRPSTVKPVVLDRTLTPGVTDPAVTQATIRATVCVAGYTATVRNVSSATKAKVFAEYHYQPAPNAQEVDHLISLELGGSNDLRNLWPQPYGGPQPTARDKDAAENRLHADVCAGRLTLAQAQAKILDPTEWHR